MQLFTDAIRRQLLANGQAQAPVRGTPAEIDFKPVVKLFTPFGGATWLLTEVEPQEPDIAFGLCDLGLGFPELGAVRLSELEQAGAGLAAIERDLFFTPDKTIGSYATEASRLGYVRA
ncbi:MAG TPA: DUF2958 domain-containing protein [Methylobacterium sp.]|jgi:hypothetical protein